MSMNKVVILLLVALVALPATAFAAQYTNSKTNQRLVEGHTSYAIMQTTRNTCTPYNDNPCPPQKEKGTAVAVLTSERQCVESDPTKVNGVLWFNDQFLVGDDRVPFGPTTPCTVRYPCGGTVYAVSPPGSANPNGASGVYQESYRITDPNNHVWIIDQWRTVTGVRIWTVNIQGSGASADGAPDSSTLTTSCAPRVDSARHSADPNPSTYQDPHCAARAANTSTAPPPCSAMANSTSNALYPSITYNALLFMRFQHLVKTGTVEYGYANLSSPGDGANSGESTIDGNSHPWNDGPTKNQTAAKHVHDTARVDIYYTWRGRTQPNVNTCGANTFYDAATKRCYWIDDTVGSTAPFDTHP